MGSRTVGMVKLTVEPNDPQLECERDPVVPHRIPDPGRHTDRLKKFPLPPVNLSVTIGVDAKALEDSITVALDSRHCQITLSGTVRGDVVAKKY